MTTLDDDRDQMRSNLDLIGRDDINDLEAMLSRRRAQRRPRAATASRTTARPSSRGTTRRAPAEARQALREGQEGAVERPDRPAPGRPRSTRSARHGQCRGQRRDAGTASALAGTALAKWDDKEWIAVRRSRTRTGCCRSSCTASRGRSLCTAKIVETVPWIDAKYYAATQVMDEARHVEVFSKYLDEKLSGHYPINAHLRTPARRHHRRLALGHDLPRHADHGRGPGAGRLRVHAPDDDRAAAQEAAPLRDGRRGAPRRLRGAQPAGVLRGARSRPSCASARSSPSRRPCACTTGWRCRRCGSAWRSRPPT